VRSLVEAAFAPPATVPFPPGGGPFRQKGNGYLGDARFYDATVRGGAGAVVAAIADPRVRAFFEQKFRPSEWYDAMPGVIIESTAARLRGIPFEQHRRQVGSWHAAEGIRGIYAALFKVVSDENIALWAPRISSLYFEFGKVETKALGGRAIEGWWRGLPPQLAQNVCYASAGFCAEALRLTGAHDPIVTLHEVEPDAVFKTTAAALETVRVRFRMAWK
jgi:hypothetical protein